MSFFQKKIHVPIRNVKAEAIDVNGNGMKNEDKYLEFEELPKVHTVSTRRIIVDCTHQAETEQGKAGLKIIFW